MSQALRPVGLAAALAVLMGGVGCTTTIRYQGESGVSAKGKTSLRVAVCDFVDMTRAQHTMHWDKGAPWTYDNLSPVCADVAAASLRRCGFFKSVDRVRREYSDGPAAFRNYDIVVAGEVREFKAGGYAHPTVFINPICALWLIGLPTVYGLEEGTCESRILLIDAKSGQMMHELFVQAAFEPVLHWEAWWAWHGHRRRRARLLTKALEEATQKEFSRRLRLDLGEDLLAMAAKRPTTVNPSGKPAKPKPVSVTQTQPNPVTPSKATFALLIGISEYKSGIPRLQYAAKDARDMRDMLLAQGVSPDNIKLLTDADATRANVASAVRSWLSRAKDATVVVHWSGHGFADPNNPGQCYFACYDTPADALTVGYKMTAFTDDIKDIGARHVVALLDTCHAGRAALRDVGGVAGGPGNDFARAMAERQRISPGMVIIAAGDADRKSLESCNWRNGALTHIALRALSGDADGYMGAGPQDRTVTLGEVKAYVQSELPKATSDLGMRACFPVIATLKGDASINELPLARVRE